MKNQVFNYLTIGLLSVFLFVSCSKEEDKDSTVESGGEITATFQFSNGESVDVAFTHKEDDLIKPYVNGPNGNDHYKMHLRGEAEIDGNGYTINIYVTMPENGVGDYPFGLAWQWHDEGFVTEIQVGFIENGDPTLLKVYLSGSGAVDNTNSKGLTISSLTDNHVKGTFSGVAAWTRSDTLEIVNGKFDTAISRGDWED